MEMVAKRPKGKHRCLLHFALLTSATYGYM